MTTQSTIPAAGQVHILRFGHEGTRRLLDGFPDERLCEQSGPVVNHALWIAGHLACTDDYFVKEFGGVDAPAVPADWQAIFGMSSTPCPDASKYPPYKEVLEALDNRRQALIAWFESLSADELAKPMPENWQEYAPTVGDLAMFVAWHESYHCGQLSVARHAAGLERTFD